MVSSLDKIKKQIEKSKIEYVIRSFRLPSDLLIKLEYTASKAGTTPNDLVKRILDAELRNINVPRGFETKKTKKKKR